MTLSIGFEFQKIDKINFTLQKMVYDRKSETNEKDSKHKKGPQHISAQIDLIYNSYFDPTFFSTLPSTNFIGIT